MSLISMMRQIVDIQRNVSSYGPAGEILHAWTTIFSQIPASIQNAGQFEITQFASRDLVVSHKIYLAQDCGLVYDDRLVLGSKYYIVRAFSDMGAQNRAWVAFVEQKNN